MAALPDYAGTYSHTSLRPVASYVARPGLQKQTEERLRDARIAGAAHSGMLPLIGLGGAGKSQLAMNYIEMHREDYATVFWVDARLRESIEQITILLKLKLELQRTQAFICRNLDSSSRRKAHQNIGSSDGGPLNAYQPSSDQNAPHFFVGALPHSTI